MPNKANGIHVGAKIALLHKSNRDNRHKKDLYDFQDLKLSVTPILLICIEISPHSSFRPMHLIQFQFVVLLLQYYRLMLYLESRCGNIATLS